jgi:hypothetical protein
MTRPQAVLATHTISSGPPASTDKRAMDTPRMEVFVDQQVEYNVAVGGFMADDNMSAHSSKSMND